MVSLVGYTGFVGSNLLAAASFDGLYNSKNICEAFGTNPDVLYYSGFPAQKFIANKFPTEDMEIIKNAAANIKKINPKKIVLISTVDVYKNPTGKTENSPMEMDGLLPYGLNRLKLEEYVQENFEDHLIIRLPGLYGKNLKKNFIYDFMSFTPAMLTDKKLQELAEIAPEILGFYNNQENGFYKLKADADRIKARTAFEKTGFSAINFTDSRGIFQFYNLEYLYEDIQTAIKNKVKKLNIATFPVSIEEIYKTLTGQDFVNEVLETPPYYDFKTIHSTVFGGQDGYIKDKEFVLADIKKYIKNNMLDF